MEDVLSIYHLPYNPKRPVVCMDECSKNLHSTPRGSLGIDTGQPMRQDYEYERHGTCNVFLFLEPLAGVRRVRVSDRRAALDFAEQLRLMVDADYPNAEKIVLVTDNLSTHTPAALYESFTPDEAWRIASKIEWHYTPEHASWLNIAEIELSVLTRQCLNRRLGSKDEVERQVTAWQDKRNQANPTVRWHFTTADARIKLRRLYPEIITHN